MHDATEGGGRVAQLIGVFKDTKEGLGEWMSGVSEWVRERQYATKYMYPFSSLPSSIVSLVINMYIRSTDEYISPPIAILYSPK